MPQIAAAQRVKMVLLKEYPMGRCPTTNLGKFRCSCFPEGVTVNRKVRVG